jgi:TRAP-type mannitol/chloroaromatic compound transport system substrate-binding protein
MKKSVSLLCVAAAMLAIASCSGNNEGSVAADIIKTPSAPIKWKLVTSWPKNFPGLGKGPETFAEYVNEMSDGS